jgi:hypothetical protein
MYKKINCKKNDKGAWCKDKRIPRSLFGLGARCCVEYDYNPKKCEFKTESPRPIDPPPGAWRKRK